MRTVYLFKRNGGFYYAQFRDPVTHRITKTLSTRTTDYAKAMSKAYEFMNSDKFAVKQTEAAHIMTLLGTSKLTVNDLLAVKMLCENLLLNNNALSGAFNNIPTNRPTDFFANILSVGEQKPKTKHKLLDFLTN
ncbi:MAG: hypothetical protein J5505_02025, partial [Spirochaetaceae bacterium]|nr:hypothetical protein [Spirochaetaceae bacterium]